MNAGGRAWHALVGVAGTEGLGLERRDQAWPRLCGPGEVLSFEYPVKSALSVIGPRRAGRS